MICSGSLIPLLFAFAGAVAPPARGEPGATGLPDASPLEAAVVACIAERWQVAPEAVRVSWPADASPPPEASLLRVVGGGSDGRLTAVLALPDGEPLTVRLRAVRRDTLRVAARDVAAGERLAPEDIRLEVRFVSGAPRPSRFDEPRPGWEVRRPLAEGDVLAWPRVVAPPAVTAGEPVRIAWSRGGVHIALDAVALNTAREGERFRIRVAGRPGVLQALATGPGAGILHLEEVR